MIENHTTMLFIMLAALFSRALFLTVKNQSLLCNNANIKRNRLRLPGPSSLGMLTLRHLVGRPAGQTADAGRAPAAHYDLNLYTIHTACIEKRLSCLASGVGITLINI